MALKNAKIFGAFYSPELIESYGRHWMFILGPRSIGKSTGIAIRSLIRFLKQGKLFMYLRRDQKELQKTYKTFFDNAIKILNNSNYNITGFKYDKGNYLIKIGDNNWEICGVTQALSQEEDLKSTTISVGTVIYDEFVSKNKNSYLGTKANFTYEYDCMYSLYMSVSRCIDNPFLSDVYVYFLGNNASYYNPFFIALGIDQYLRSDSKIIAPKGEEWILQQIQEGDIEAVKNYQESIAYKLGNKANRDYAFKNIAFDSSDQFIKKINAPKQPIINMSYRKHKMGVYLIPTLGVYYISNKSHNGFNLALTCGDQDNINYVMANKYQDHYALVQLKSAIQMGKVFFENAKIKYEITNYLMLTN